MIFIVLYFVVYNIFNPLLKQSYQKYLYNNAVNYLRDKEYILIEPYSHGIGIEIKNAKISEKDFEMLSIVSNNVYYLSLINCEYEYSVYNTLPKFNNLSYLNISYSIPTNIKFRISQVSLSNLQELCLTNVILDKNAMKIISSAKNIDSISIFKSRIDAASFNSSNIDVKHWRRIGFQGSIFDSQFINWLSSHITYLEFIFLSGTNISDEDLLKLPNTIEQIDICQTTITANGVIKWITEKRSPVLKRFSSDIDFTEEELEIIKQHNIEINESLHL